MVRSRAVRAGSAKAVISTLLLALIALCLLAMFTLNSGHARMSETERDAQNATASALYVHLATLAYPATSADMTHALLDFIRNDDLIKGITLFDTNSQLIAQLGTGNDALLPQPTALPTARIPIRSPDNSFYGHAIVAFQPSRDTLARSFHYAALTAVSLMLALAVVVLLHIHRRLPEVIAVMWRAHDADPV